MKLIFSKNAWEDYLYWQKTDKKMLKRINSIIHEIMRNPFTGSGKPEPLKHGLSGYWSRRINDEHRIVYRPAEDAVLALSLLNSVYHRRFVNGCERAFGRMSFDDFLTFVS